MSEDGQIVERLQPIICDCLDLDDLEIHRALTADEVEGWDSVAHVRIILAVERAFRIRFSASEVGSFQDVGDLIDSIRRKLG